ncbi:hypothetical protein BSZ19_24600 [Bradyrhizobium japonicum]|uniref:Uncharacterized protein n=1 Tax=Bradyrhizobium japonicum TaxID=375 RepID=A0A1Y2JK64_BRAJP|nr:hypothetical protein [Bradyrhizobium japonicum]OSJ30396.1 hypothetical protein BSZ19_24600 [Bradyrhizobium japonicum]
MMDLALMLELLIDDPGSRAPAVLLRSEGLRLIDELNYVVGLDPLVDDTTGVSVPQLCARLAAAGYKLRPSIDAPTFADRRRRHGGCVRAAAEHLGTTAAPLLP